MKRVLLASLVLGLSTVAVFADADIKAVQRKLKEGGFYRGEVNGQPGSDLSAAITRYQIRNGLQITGKLDPETSRSLGVKAEMPAAAPAPGAETWRELRSDKPVTSQTTPPTKSAAKVTSQVANESPKHALQVAADNQSKVLLSRERLRDYVAAFVLAGLDPEVGAELEFFGDRVRYYDDGILDREKIRRDLLHYDAEWPERHFWLTGELEVAPQPDSTVRVTFPIRYQVRNGDRHASGVVQKTLLLEVIGQDLQIVGVAETKAR